MPLDQLLAALEREAIRTAEQLLANARAEADQLTAGAEHDIARRREIAVAAAARGQRAALERAISDATRTARRDTLTAREDLLTRVFDAVRRELPSAIAQPSYLTTLPTHVAAATACFDAHEPTVLRGPASLLGPLRSIVAGNTAITVQQADDAGNGFRLTTADGTIEVDGTLESRLDGARASLARKALRQVERTA